MRSWIITILTGTVRNIANESYRLIAVGYENSRMETSVYVDMLREYELEISWD